MLTCVVRFCFASSLCDVVLNNNKKRYKTTDCSDQKRRLASLLADQNREEGNDGQQQEEAAGCWRELDICSLGAYSSAPIPLSRVYIATVAASKRNSNNNDNSYTMNTNTNTNKEGWRHQVLLLGPGAAPPTCSTVLSVPASPGSSGGNSNGSNSDGPPPDPRLRIFIKPRYSRDAGAGPSYPGYLATADPMLLVAEATWGFELVLPENIEYAHILLAIIIYPRRSMRGVGVHITVSTTPSCVVPAVPASLGSR